MYVIIIPINDIITHNLLYCYGIKNIVRWLLERENQNCRNCCLTNHRSPWIKFPLISFSKGSRIPLGKLIIGTDSSRFLLIGFTPETEECPSSLDFLPNIRIWKLCTFVIAFVHVSWISYFYFDYNI